MVSTLPVSQLTSAYTLEKIGRIYSQKNVSVSPELSGEIQEILVQDGDMVEIGDPLFRLGLENSNIDIALNQSQRSVEKAQLNLDSITNSQNQQLSSAISSLQRSQIEWDTFIQDKPYAQEILSDTLFHADPDQLGSRAQISIISSQANLDKLKMDYNNKLLSDDQTKQGYR
ncbi:MAG: biotin/lipoyl-binding protein [Patescibacteria group bacterium]|nr:biotin/lipoyl-binding protein [Patescibacteria group bacterium]